MYCSGCGTEISSELNYCKRCGSRVPKSESASVAENLSKAISYIGGFGLLGFIVAVLMMVRRGVVPDTALVLISFFYLATLFGICFLILRQTAPFAGRKQNNLNRDLQAAEAPAYLSPATTAQLPEPNDQPISVTEHTTRTLDKIPVARK